MWLSDAWWCTSAAKRETTDSVAELSYLEHNVPWQSLSCRLQTLLLEVPSKENEQTISKIHDTLSRLSLWWDTAKHVWLSVQKVKQNISAVSSNGDSPQHSRNLDTSHHPARAAPRTKTHTQIKTSVSWTVWEIYWIVVLRWQTKTNTYKILLFQMLCQSETLSKDPVIRGGGARPTPRS